MLNMALTGKPTCGFLKGHYYFLVGDSQSGKTFLALTCLAEASINPEFKEYRFIFDNGEGGALMDMGKFFGQRVVDRMEPPAMKAGEPVCSETIEEFYYHISDVIDDGRPFIYILDSMDSLTSESEQNKLEEKREAHAKGKTTTGSMQDGKPKANSQGIRQLLQPLSRTGSILIIINQTRDNIGGYGFEKKTRSGGHALTFYASIEMWSSRISKIKKTIRGKPRQIGDLCAVRTKKNRLQGKDRTVTVPIYWSVGIDDVGSMVDYLVEENHWTANKGGKIRVPEFDIEVSREKLIRHIQHAGLERDVQEIVRDVWDEIEEACAVKRKSRYA